MNHLLSSYQSYIVPAIIAVLTVGIMKLGFFVTHADLEQSLRGLEHTLQSQYARQKDIEDIKTMLSRLDIQISRIEDRINQTNHAR